MFLLLLFRLNLEIGHANWKSRLPSADEESQRTEVVALISSERSPSGVDIMQFQLHSCGAR